jgi:hypothetical protein
MSSGIANTSVRIAPAIERRFRTFFVSPLLHLVLLGLGVAAASLLAMSVALILSLCSLMAIWWVRSDSRPHAKTAATVIALGGLWLLLVQMLQTTRDSGAAALAWSVCIFIQVVLTGFAVTILELSTSYSAAAPRSRFSLQYLFIWTTLLAFALGGAGFIASKFGFKLADVPNWNFFMQLQGVAVAGAALAAAVYTSIRLPQTWLVRGLASAATTVAGAAVAPLCLLAIFGDNVGAHPVDLVWLFTGQSLCLLSVLVPLEYVRSIELAGGHDHQSSAATSNGSSSLARVARS